MMSSFIRGRPDLAPCMAPCLVTRTESVRLGGPNVVPKFTPLPPGRPSGAVYTCRRAKPSLHLVAEFNLLARPVPGFGLCRGACLNGVLPVVRLTNQTGPAAVSRRASPKDQPARRRRAKD